MTTHCQYCTTTLCEGCKAKYSFRNFTAEEAEWHSNVLKRRSVSVMKLYDLTNKNDHVLPQKHSV